MLHEILKRLDVIYNFDVEKGCQCEVCLDISEIDRVFKIVDKMKELHDGDIVKVSEIIDCIKEIKLEG